MEKNPESEEDLLEHRTDGTDAFDTLYIGCEKFPQHYIYPLMVGGVSYVVNIRANERNVK